MVAIKETLDILYKVSEIKSDIDKIDKMINRFKNPISILPLGLLIPVSLVAIFIYMLFNASSIIALPIGLAFVIFLWILLWYLGKLVPKSDKTKERISELTYEKQIKTEQYLDLNNALNNSVVPPDYRTIDIVTELDKYLDSGEAESLNDAIYIYKINKLNEKVAMQDSELNKMKSEMNNLKKTNKELKADVQNAKSSASTAKLWSITKK